MQRVIKLQRVRIAPVVSDKPKFRMIIRETMNDFRKTPGRMWRGKVP